MIWLRQRAALATLVLAACAALAWHLAAPQGTIEEPRDPLTTLEGHLRYAPSDARGWILLARMRMDANLFEGAADAYERAIATSRKVAQDPQIWCELADALGMTQGGTLRGRPRELIDKALRLQPDHPRALEMAGSAEYEAQNFPAALRYWETLLAQLRPQSSAHAELASAVARTRRLAAQDRPS